LELRILCVTQFVTSITMRYPQRCLLASIALAFYEIRASSMVQPLD